MHTGNEKKKTPHLTDKYLVSMLTKNHRPL